MSETIQIVVQDKVASSIATKLRDIASNARDADSAIVKLQTQLALLKGGAFQKVVQDSNSAVNAMAKVAVSSQRLANEQHDLAYSSAKVAAAQNQATQESLKTQLANVNLEIATKKLTVAKQAALQAEIATSTAMANSTIELNKAIASETALQSVEAKVTESKIKAAIASEKLNAEQHKTSISASNAAAAQLKVVTAATQGQTAAQGLAVATARTATEQVKTALAAQKLATEQQNTARVTANAAAASDRAASAALRLQQQQIKIANAAAKAEASQNTLTGSIHSLYQAQEIYNRSIKEAMILYNAGAINLQTYNNAVNLAKANLQAASVGNSAYSAGLTKLGNNAKLSNHHLTNLAFQLQDIAVTMQMGQNPMQIFMQQGTQIAAIASQAGVSLGTMGKAAVTMLGQMTMAVGRLLVVFWPVTAAIGVLFGSFKLFQAEVSKTAELDNYARSLGATKQQIEELNLDVVTFSDTMSGLWQTIKDNSPIDEVVGGWYDAIKNFSVNALKAILEFLTKMALSSAAHFQAQVATMQEAFSRIPAIAKQFVQQSANFVISIVENAGNGVIGLVNLAIEGLNKIGGVEIQPLKLASFDRVKVEVAEFGKSLGEVYTESYNDSLKSNSAKIEKFMSDFQKNTANAAKNRIRSTMEELNPKTGSTGANKEIEDRAAALRKVNLELDNQLVRMQMLQPEREKQVAFDRIEEKLAGKKITLSQDEARAIRAKTDAIVEQMAVQQQFDAIYQEAVGPLRQYEATLSAIDQAVQKKVLSEAQAAAQVDRATEAYKNAADPMRQYNKDLQDQFKLLSMLPAQREIEAKMIQLEREAIEKGIPDREKYLQQKREELALLQQFQGLSNARDKLRSEYAQPRQEFTDRQTAIGEMVATGNQQNMADARAAQLSDLSGMGIDTSMFQSQLQTQEAMFADYLAKIETMRAANALSEQEYANASLQIQMQRENMRLNSSKNFFSSLEGLQSSSNKKIAAIGKAAAIANAIISTYQSANSAYAAMAGIPIVGPALGVAAAAAAIAAGMANVAAIRSQGPGFKQGGYTGNMGVDEVAGVVHGREFVMDAAATSRIGVANLEAMRSGASISDGNVGSTKVVMVSFDIDNNIQASGGKSETSADSLERAATIISKRTQSDILDSIRNGGTWAKVIKQAA